MIKMGEILIEIANLMEQILAHATNEPPGNSILSGACNKPAECYRISYI